MKLLCLSSHTRGPNTTHVSRKTRSHHQANGVRSSISHITASHGFEDFWQVFFLTRFEWLHRLRLPPAHALLRSSERSAPAPPPPFVWGSLRVSGCYGLTQKSKRCPASPLQYYIIPSPPNYIFAVKHYLWPKQKEIKKKKKVEPH